LQGVGLSSGTSSQSLRPRCTHCGHRETGAPVPEMDRMPPKTDTQFPQMSVQASKMHVRVPDTRKQRPDTYATAHETPVRLRKMSARCLDTGLQLRRTKVRRIATASPIAINAFPQPEVGHRHSTGTGRKSKSQCGFLKRLNRLKQGLRMLPVPDSLLADEKKCLRTHFRSPSW
jgi:hypothetical protein